MEKFWKQANPSEPSLCAGFCSVLLDPAEETALMDFGDGGGGSIAMSNSCDPMDYSPPGSSVKFSRQEYWSGLPFPSTGDLPDPWIEPWFPVLQIDFLRSEP